MTPTQAKMEIWRTLVSLKVDNPQTNHMSGMGYVPTRPAYPDPVAAALKANEVFDALKLPKAAARRK